MPLVNRTLKKGEKLVAVYGGTRYVLDVADVPKEGKPTFRMLEPVKFKGKDTHPASLRGGEDGKTFSSLSAAASALTFPGRYDGWHFWTREEDWESSLEMFKRGEKPKADKLAKEAKPKAEKKAAPKASAPKPQPKTAAGKSPAKAAAKPTSEGSAKVAPKAAKPRAAADAKPKSGGKPAVAAAARKRPAKAEADEPELLEI